MSSAVDKEIDSTSSESSVISDDDRIASAALPPWVWLALGVLLLLALLVIFVLPQLVADYELPFTPRSETEVVVAGSAGTSSYTPISPFDEAQRARERKEAQDVLAELLRKQQELVELEVETWAPEPYQQALEAARLGDEAYRNQTFAEASIQYAKGEQLLAGLLDSVPEVFNRYLSEGEAALLAGDAGLAEESFLVALTLQSDSSAAGTGLERALTLDQVLELRREAESLRTQGDLAAARTLLTEAAELDPLHQGVGQDLQEVRQAIADREFTAVMSEGFALLQRGESEAAITAFERALRMRPQSAQAQEAINQTRNEIAIAQINRARDLAQTQVASEKWAEAVAAYDTALAVDNNLVFATEGRDYAQKRLQLDQLLEQAIQQPERLADEAVYEQVVGIYYAGRDLADAGPRLQQQLDTLESLLRQARQPVEVELLSDNATEITLYQVGALGKFERQNLTLQPGQYVAVGTRPGYRDVRREFTVGFGHNPGPITIQCNEMIAANGRR
ncbi:MAG: hypothetical protein RQ757_11220 [Pseudomonadales bacterium]|nr:hypothetical protein [Pseudomonadales bacterium]